ncbi:MAG: GDP-mannose 4,6-dehydratase [Cyclobacteriaceae bacterium]
MSQRILITGSAGFIGFHLSKKLLEDGFEVIGIDNINDYYDVNLKLDRLKILEGNEKFDFRKVDVSQKEDLTAVFESGLFDGVIHLAAQAGVRYSITHPDIYIASNIVGFHNMLECVRTYGTKHFIFASSSSVYGANAKLPFSTSDSVDRPISLYAATKKSNELMAYTYSHLYQIPTTALRFFTVYGSWGRPDMALYKFAEKIKEGKPIQIYNNGNMMRDFTHVNDIVESIIRLMPKPPGFSEMSQDSSGIIAPYNLFNIGSNNPVKLMEYVKILEDKLGIEAIKEFMPMQAGDVKDTFADVEDLIEYISYKPSTKIEVGMEEFVDWFLDYKKTNMLS